MSMKVLNAIYTKILNLLIMAGLYPPVVAKITEGSRYKEVVGDVEDHILPPVDTLVNSRVTFL